jgi:hypothetical protein
MGTQTVHEQDILDELHQLPPERWGDVLLFIRSLQRSSQAPATERPIRCGTDLAGSDLIGIWANRTDITDNREFARQLRERAEQRKTGLALSHSGHADS